MLVCMTMLCWSWQLQRPITASDPYHDCNPSGYYAKEKQGCKKGTKAVSHRHAGMLP